MAREDVIEDLTMVLLYLSSWVEGTFYGDNGVEEIRRSWKTAEPDALDTLRERGCLNYTPRAKTTYITPLGVRAAAQAIERYGLQTWLDAPKREDLVIDPPPEEPSLEETFLFLP